MRKLVSASGNAVKFGDKNLKIRESIRSRTQDDERYVEGRKILLKREIPINGDKHLKLLRGQRKQFPVLDG